MHKRHPMNTTYIAIRLTCSCGRTGPGFMLLAAECSLGILSVVSVATSAQCAALPSLQLFQWLLLCVLTPFFFGAFLACGEAIHHAQKYVNARGAELSMRRNCISTPYHDGRTDRQMKSSLASQHRCSFTSITWTLWYTMSLSPPCFTLAYLSPHWLWRLLSHLND